ncbi:hypothetical protein ACLMJK_008335 [Lecanora helva]
MGLSKNIKGDHPNRAGITSPNSQNPAEAYAPPPGPPSSHRSRQEQHHYLPPPGPPPGSQEYAPPPGPPPGRQEALPSQHLNSMTATNPTSDLAQSQLPSDPPPYHDWTVIPDTALLPPPPAIGYDTSPNSNADSLDADQAHEWCRLHPMMAPHQPTNAQYQAVARGDVRLSKAVEYKGDLLMPDTGLWKGSTPSGSKDACLLSSLPLYFAVVDAPTVATKTIYYEVKIRSLGRGRGADESSIALGYCALPYPTWRMPGWERGSLAVHGDDGRKYVNDTYGGKDLTSPFRVGDTIGLGMTFSAVESPPEYGTPRQGSIRVSVFLTRNGEKGESWNLHEELDASHDLSVVGLNGELDLHAAVGIFGGVEFDLSFNRRYWLWRPR